MQEDGDLYSTSEVPVDAQEVLGDEEQREQLLDAARLAKLLVPLSLAYLTFIHAILAPVLDYRLPGFVPVDRIAGWLWLNGGLLGVAVWSVRTGRLPLAGGKWVTGKRMIWILAGLIANSIAWFMLPDAVHTAKAALLAARSDW